MADIKDWETTANNNSEKAQCLPEDDDEGVGIPLRENWSSKIEFILATLGYVVGYGNFWRFPYLCYRSGGASFLIPYFLMLFLIGIPMFFMELSIGQWYGRGMVGVWKAVCPLASGLGYATMMVQFLSSVYYIVILGWVLFYLFDSFRSQVPWETCDNDWNTPFCRRERTADQTVNCSAFALPVNCTQKFISPSSEYWTNRVLQMTDSIEDSGSMRWELVGTLALAWVMVYFCIFKSVRLTGKIVYFTALFPYIVLFCLLIRGVTLEGAGEGLIFYLKPDFSKLADPQVWVFAGTQIYWSLGVGFGGMITFASYNKFRNDIHRDSLVIAFSNCGTSFFAGFAVFSILGFMAYVLRTTVGKVADSGPGLVFIVYPEAISQMPLSVMWSILFFVMLVTLGLDTMFGAIEAFVTAIVDEYPKLRAKKWLVVLISCLAMFLCGLACVTQGGMYVFNLFDYQSAGLSLMFLVLLENIFVAWIYGIENFSDDIEAMTGKRPSLWIRISLKYIAPFCSSVIVLANIIQWNGIKYDGNPYPDWAELIGWIMCISPMLIAPAVAIYVFWRARGTLRERWETVTTPDQATLAGIEEKYGIDRNRHEKIIYL